ncbi:hypothetical protein EGI20_08850 [Aquitalea sp. S1-19]|nr:hypothetical protein [Aquitalea sp. S1-19]
MVNNSKCASRHTSQAKIRDGSRPMPHTARQHGKTLLALSLFVQLAAYVAASMAQAQEPASSIPTTSPATDFSLPPAIAMEGENTKQPITSTTALSVIGAPALAPLPSSTALRLKENNPLWAWLSLDGSSRPSFKLYQDKSSRLALNINGNGSLRLRYKLAW